MGVERFMVALVISWAVATQSFAEEADESVPQRDEASRSTLIRVVDDSGAPLPQVNVYVTGIGDKRNLPRKNYSTDASGQVEIEVAADARLLQLWPSKPGYVPQAIRFDESEADQGRAIPDEYLFHFRRGTRLSGQVVDDTGKPIAGVKVNVRVSGVVDLGDQSRSTIPAPGVNVWLANGSDAAVTDASGRWEIVNAPAATPRSDFTFRLLVTHPDFAGDTNWGESQRKQGVTDEQLRDGSAKLMLRRGTAIAGTITGPNGEPVTEGLVIWDDRPYWATGVNETQIDESGRYETLRLAPGDYPVTVVAPGYAPTQRTVSVSRSLQDVDFQLQAGNPIKLEIVDDSGQAIPRAHVSLGQWRSTEALYNMKHSSVPPSGIPRRADADGIYGWDWAPSDGVEYRIGAQGYDSKSVTLVAKEESHRIVLHQPLAIFGRVVDAETDQLIESFRVLPVKAFRPDFYSTDFQKGRVVQGKEGQYKIVINSHGEGKDRHRVRIEAEGYRTAFGEKSIAAGDPPLEQNFRLQPVPAMVGRVVDADQQPVDSFTVAIGTPTTSPHFNLDRIETSFGQAFVVEGKSQFELAATFEPQRIRVYNDFGFAEVLRQPTESIGTITLQPWASISGRLTQGGQPIGDESIYFRPLARYELTEARFQDSFATKTDAQGHFRFDKLPPIRGSVRAHLGPWRDSALTSSASVPLDLKAGVHQEVLLGGDGAEVAGRVIATGRSNDDLSKQWSINYLVSRDMALPSPPGSQPLSFDGSGSFDVSWLKHSDFGSWLSARENHYVKLAADGRFWVHGVRPGAYDLVIQLYEQPAGCLVETIGEKVIPVTVSQQQADAGELSLGEIEVSCRQGPRPGTDMRAFQFTDKEGRVRYVDDVEGGYVLFHVWASWCAPCIAAMPELKHAAEIYAQDPITIVGLNLDREDVVPKLLAQDGEWDWAHNYLGEDSDMMRQLAVSSVPSYYLIGPDGKLVASANQWAEMEQLLQQKLR